MTDIDELRLRVKGIIGRAILSGIPRSEATDAIVDLLTTERAKVAALEAEVESLKDRMQFNKVDQHYAHIAAMKIAEAEATRWREVATDLAQIVQGLEATICHVNPSSVALASRAALTRYKQERDQ